MTFSDLLVRVDPEKVINAIRKTDGPPLPDYDEADARELVWATLEKYLLRDYEEFEITGVEDACQMLGQPGLRAIFDLTGRMRGNHARFRDYKNQVFILDWKTSRRDLDKTWVEGYIDSWQWRIYAYLSGAKLFFYRGLRRPQKVGGFPEFREIIIEVPDSVFSEVSSLVEQVSQQINSLLSNPGPWPRVMRPNLCKPYGKSCFAYDDCRGGTIPEQLIKTPTLSYTRIQQFMECNEKFRRIILSRMNEEEDPETSEATIFGNAVHRGLAAAYSQVFGLDFLSEEGQ
jgi:hypothetical protein